MKVKIYFGFWEVVILLVGTITFKLLLLYPLLVIDTGQTAAILVSLLASVVSLGLLLLLLRRYGNNPNVGIFTLLERRFGVVGRVVGAGLIFVYFLWSASLTLRQVSDGLIAVSYPHTPALPIMLLFTIAAALAAFIGVKAVVRLNALIAPVILLFMLLIVAVSAGFFDLSYAFPLFGNGTSSFLRSLTHIGFFSDILLAFVIAERVEPTVSLQRAVLTAGGLSAALFVLIIAAYTLTVPYPINADFLLPIYQLERFFSVGALLQRGEFLFIFAWSLAFFLYLSTLFYCCCLSFNKMVNRRGRGAIAPLAALMLLLAYLPRDTAAILRIMPMLLLYSLFVCWMIPLLTYGKPDSANRAKGVKS